MSSSTVLSWTNQDPRQSALVNQYGAVYTFTTENNARGVLVTTVMKQIRSNREDKVAKLEWSTAGGLGRVIIGKSTYPMTDLVRPSSNIPGCRSFNGPDGFQYRWRPSASATDVVLQDPNDNVIAYIRNIRTRHQLGDIFAELHFISNAGSGVVMHPPMMDQVVVTAMLYRFVTMFNL